MVQRQLKIVISGARPSTVKTTIGLYPILEEEEIKNSVNSGNAFCHLVFPFAV